MRDIQGGRKKKFKEIREGSQRHESREGQKKQRSRGCWDKELTAKSTLEERLSKGIILDLLKILYFHSCHLY